MSGSGIYSSSAIRSSWGAGVAASASAGRIGVMRREPGQAFVHGRRWQGQGARAQRAECHGSHGAQATLPFDVQRDADRVITPTAVGFLAIGAGAGIGHAVRAARGAFHLITAVTVRGDLVVGAQAQGLASAGYRPLCPRGNTAAAQIPGPRSRVPSLLRYPRCLVPLLGLLVSLLSALLHEDGGSLGRPANLLREGRACRYC